jgi:hypothetical protein
MASGPWHTNIRKGVIWLHESERCMAETSKEQLRPSAKLLERFTKVPVILDDLYIDHLMNPLSKA